MPEDRVFEMTQERINDLNNNNNMMTRNRIISAESSSSSPTPKGFSIDQDLTDDERSKSNNHKNGLPIEIIQFSGKFLVSIHSSTHSLLVICLLFISQILILSC